MTPEARHEAAVKIVVENTKWSRDSIVRMISGPAATASEEPIQWQSPPFLSQALLMPEDPAPYRSYIIEQPAEAKPEPSERQLAVQWTAAFTNDKPDAVDRYSAAYPEGPYAAAVSAYCLAIRHEATIAELRQALEECMEVACAETCDHVTQRDTVHTPECISAHKIIAKADERQSQ